MKHFKWLLLSILMPMLCSCALIGDRLATINNVQEMQRRIGYPDKIMEAPSGNRLYVYKWIDKHERPAIYNPGTVMPGGVRLAETYIPGHTSIGKCTIWIEADNEGNVVNTDHEGNKCPASLVKQK